MHLTASTFLGGPERQMVELARSLPSNFTTVFASFEEKGLAQPFLTTARSFGFPTEVVRHDRPRCAAACREIAHLLKAQRIDVLCTHGYKPNLLGLVAARRAGLPVVAVSRGWTGAGLRARIYEAVDRFALRWMDRVVCVSHAQREKVLATGVPDSKVSVIQNAIRVERFAEPNPKYRARLEALFPHPRAMIVGAGGRLSPEKGFDILVEAASDVIRDCPEVGFVLFGEGSLRKALSKQIRGHGIEDSFRLVGFRSDLDHFVPWFDALVLPSYTEGLPNVVLEAMAAGVPVVATAVGGTPELVKHGVNGHLVPSGDIQSLAQGIRDLLNDPRKQEMGRLGHRTVAERFSFELQAKRYQELFLSLRETRSAALVSDRSDQACEETATALARRADATWFQEGRCDGV